jgi:hypothetical protein
MCAAARGATMLGMTRTKRIPMLDSPSLTLRVAGPADADELRRLAELDSASVPRGEVLVAEVGGSLWAAVSLEDHHAIADPFRPSGELVFLLHERARGVRSRHRDRLLPARREAHRRRARRARQAAGVL